jgi:AraC-like DNA-binding protein
LPIQYRWEVTRRHPYYQSLWLLARAYYRNEPVEYEVEPVFHQIAVAILGTIGVSGEPPDPATEFAELGAGKLRPAWLSGAVHPITLRNIASLLIAALPKETVGYVGLQLMEAGCDDRENEPPQQAKALMNLATLDKPGLDCYLDEPIVSVNPAASGRQITAAVAESLKHWKSQRGLEEKRDRSDKYADYLRVWDLREGWTGASYDLSREKKLKEVAAELKMEPSTVAKHYRSAFEMIIGRPYSPGMWFRVFGVAKVADLTGDDLLGPVTHRRPSVSPTRRPVPETVLGCVSKEGESRSPSAESHAPESTNTAGIIEQIRSLLNQESDDKRIADRLGLGHEVVPAIAYLRQRNGELT